MSEAAGGYELTVTYTPEIFSVIRFRFDGNQYVYGSNLRQVILQLINSGNYLDGFLGAEARINKACWCPVADSLTWQTIAQISLARLQESEASRGDRRGWVREEGCGGGFGIGDWDVLGDK